MTAPMLKENKGFTLVEILVVVAILGLVMGSIYSIYLTNMKSAYSQQEVVEVQQNLRIAMDSITKDIRMAGMLVPSSTPPITTGSANATSISLNTASARGVYARIDTAPTITAGNTVLCEVESPETVDVFIANPGKAVRIFRPVDCSQPFSTAYSVASTNRATPSLTLQRTSGSFAGGEILKRGDMIAMTENVVYDPNTIVYAVVAGGTDVSGVICPQNQQCIVRNANGTGVITTGEIIASNISSLVFSYILDDYTEVPTTTDLDKVRAVRVTITGQTAATAQLSGGNKTRQLTSIVKIHNRR